MADMVAALPAEKRKAAIADLQKIVAKDFRFWFGQVEDIGKFATSGWPDSDALLQKMLRADVETGPQCIAIPYLSVKLFMAYRRVVAATDKWVHETTQNQTINVGGPAKQQDVCTKFVCAS